MYSSMVQGTSAAKNNKKGVKEKERREVLKGKETRVTILTNSASTTQTDYKRMIGRVSS